MAACLLHAQKSKCTGLGSPEEANIAAAAQDACLGANQELIQCDPSKHFVGGEKYWVGAQLFLHSKLAAENAHLSKKLSTRISSRLS